MSDDKQQQGKTLYQEKIDEFRANNIKLLKENKALTDKYKDVDLERYNILIKQQEDLEDKKLLEAGKVDEMIASKVKAVQESHAEQYKKIEDQNSQYEKQLEELLIDTTVKDLAAKSGVQSEALNTVAMLARHTFKVVNGVPTALDASGNSVMEHGTTNPMTLKAWMKNLETTDSYLFSKSSGSKSSHNSSGSADRKSVSRETFNGMSQQDRFAYTLKGGTVVDA